MKHVLGGIAMNDAIGPFSRTSVQASYAIHLPLFKTINMGAGLSVGWSNFELRMWVGPRYLDIIANLLETFASEG